MNDSRVALLTSVALFVTAAQAQAASRPDAAADAQSEFLEAGQWWNLFFAEGNDPLRRGTGSINAVKIVQLRKTHPSWVQIAFPKNRKEHFGIFGPAAKAHDDDSIDLEAALADWEKGITQWKVIWINLDFVVYMSKVGHSHTPELAAEPGSNGRPAPAR